MRNLLLTVSALAAFPIVSAFIWLIWVVHAFDLQPPMGRVLKAAAGL